MQHIQGISRHQLQMSSLEDKISADNSVRFIDVFVNHIDVEKLDGKLFKYLHFEL
ncbi:hypothetical protein [Flavobacterium sp.]|uniref:hypothetical protein n=1 Tax=Flavobacterium sp. TaxID=239 RepID=UPI003F698276